MESVTYPVALDENNNLITINDAVHGQKYFCPECHGEMIPRLGEINVHHFAHKNFSRSCATGESGYHAVAKWMLAYYFQTHPKIEFKVRCDVCGRPFKIIEEIEKVEVEKGESKGFRPDLMITFKSGEKMPCEVIYQHPVELENVGKYFDYKYILVWKFKGQVTEVPVFTPISEADYYDEIQYYNEEQHESIADAYNYGISNILTHKLSKREDLNSKVSLFITNKGEKRHNSGCQHLPYAMGYIFQTQCYYCHKKINIAKFTEFYPSNEKVEYLTYNGKHKPMYEYIPPDAIMPALWEKINKIYHTNLYPDHSKMADKTYLMNHCPYCEAKIGDLFEDGLDSAGEKFEVEISANEYKS
ncbi:MAG: hypothetical protein M1542_08335 [Thermotogae bacterium]|jgi:hypothetical protein|nr:hypothetical protein [Thermotogota bacterium]MCL5033235.1 hypothetical protein [Thermotogota bacterium]